jgi:hypothetical protein
MKTEKDVEQAFEHLLEEIIWLKHVDIEESGILSALNFSDCTVTTFEHAGVLTANRGLVLTTAEGAEFQISILQTKKPKT